MKNQISSKSQGQRKLGIHILKEAPWGIHFCQFYQTKNDLLEILVPYFKTGLKNNEFCMWITTESISLQEAKTALEKALPDLDQFLKRGQIEIIPYTEWYLKSGIFESQRVLDGLVNKLESALFQGYDGLRLSGDTIWLEKKDWRKFTDYEEEVNNVIRKYKMIALCTYSLDKCGSLEVIDVVRNHQCALINREGKWEQIESSDYKRSAMALQQAYLDKEKIMESIFESYFVLDRDWRLKEVNMQAAASVGMKKEDIIGKVFWELFPEALNSEFEWQYRKAVKENVPVHFECQSNISHRWEEVRAYPNREGLAVYFHDINWRKQVEESLRKSETRLKIALRNSPVAVFTHDLDLRYTWIYNPHKYLAKKDIVRKTDWDLYSPEQAGYLTQIKKEVLSSGQGTSCEIMLTYGRENFYNDLTIEPLYDNNQTIIGLICSSVDNTQRKLAQEILKRDKETFEKMVEEKTQELISTQLQLEKSKRLSDIGALAATIAHELRNPLGAIGIAAYNLKRKIPPGAALEKHLKNIEKKITESNEIINNLLYYSRLRSPHLEPTNIHDILTECTDMAANQFHKKAARVSKKFYPLRHLFIKADPLLMKELFGNVLNNAFDALAADRKGEVEIAGEVLDSRAIKIRVKDNGIGIEKEALSKVYEPFFTTKSRGTGLGLSVAYQIVQLHNGNIVIESESARGTTVTVTLPVGTQ